MSSVFDGGVGIARGGIVERSIDMFAFLDSRDVGREDGGELSKDILEVCAKCYEYLDECSNCSRKVWKLMGSC